MRIIIEDVVNSSKGKFLLEKRKYTNYGNMQYGRGKVVVSVVGIFDTEVEAKMEKKRLLSKKHEPYSLMFKIRQI